jgi:hypothetical protein
LGQASHHEGRGGPPTLPRAKEYFLSNDDRVYQLLHTPLAVLVLKILEHVPEIEDASEQFSIPFIGSVKKPGDLVATIVATLSDENIANAGLFTSLVHTLYDNVCRASGIQPGTDSKKPYILPEDSDLPALELAETYLRGTPFLKLLKTPVPLPLDLETRFSHHWIVAPPGAGKSTALQYLISRDLKLVEEGRASVVVMESNRDLIKAIEGLKTFAPGEPLAGKLLSIDIEDVEWPVALNLFDIGMEGIAALPARDQEALLNSVLYLYDYIFGALLSAELTSRQNTLFNFTIQLLLQINLP